MPTHGLVSILQQCCSLLTVCLLGPVQREIPKRCLPNSFFFFLGETAKKLICTKLPQTSECLEQILGFLMTWSLFPNLFWRESKSHSHMSLLTSRIVIFCFCFHIRSRAWSVSPPCPRQWFSLQTYAYLLLPLWASWAVRPWCWLPDKEQTGQSEDSQHQS